MNEPQFEFGAPEAAIPERPHRRGWIALFLIMGTLIAGQLAMYFGRSESESDPFLEVSTGFRAAVLESEAFKRLKWLPTSASETAIAGSLDELVSQVVGSRKTNATAARLYAAMRTEQKKTVEEADLELLLKSEKPEERAFAEIYRRKSLTVDEAKSLSENFPPDAFSYRMASLHAREKAGEAGVRARFFPDSELFRFFVGFGLIFAALLVGMSLLTLYAGMRFSGRWAPVGHPAGKLTAAEADTYAGRAAIMMAGFIGFGVAISLALGPFLAEEFVNVLVGAATTAFAFLLLTKWRVSGGPTMRLFARERNQFWGDVAWGFLGAIANVPLLLCCAIAGKTLFSGLPGPEHPISSQIQSGPGLLTLVMLGIAAAVFAPLFEEICFRGTITPAMERLLGGPAPGIVAAGLLFAAIHPQGIAGWLPLAMVGSFAAMLTYQRGSLVPAIAMHATHNASLLIITLTMT